MTRAESLAAVLERDHLEIDAGLGLAARRPLRDQDLPVVLRAITALRRHIYLEEELVFPALYRAGLVAPVFVMLREHAQIWETLDALERELGLPGAGEAVAALGARLAAQLQHHNVKEEKILYPAADDALTADAAARSHTFLATGELPAGWVCTRLAGR